MPKNYPIAGARIERIRRDAARCITRETPHGGRMWYNHGSLCYTPDGKGRSQVLLMDCAPGGVLNEYAHTLTRILQHADPATMGELARGYALALDAGLIKEHDNA